MFDCLFKSRSSKSSKLHPFTEEQVKAKAYELWQQRGSDSTSEENWHDAIHALQREEQRKRMIKPIRRLWWKTGLGTHIQRGWKWTGIPEKKGWDFAQLLAVPLVLAVVGWGLNEYAKGRDYRLADDKAKQDTLVKYLDQMADSLSSGLRKAKTGDDKFIVAQSRTVLALQSLDRKRQHLVVQFLRASGLGDAPDNPWGSKIDDHSYLDNYRNFKNLPVQSKVLLYKAQMEKANLANSDLSGAVLIGADLHGANLSCDPPDSKDENKCSDLDGADLRGADLSDANLKGASLCSANLTGANLTRANLNEAGLCNAKLIGANLNAAKLIGADLTYTHLYFANLGNADLSETQNLTDFQLTSTRLCSTKLPTSISLAPDRNCQE